VEAHIELMDEDIGSDDMCDRVDVSEPFLKGRIISSSWQDRHRRHSRNHLAAGPQCS
jgi:hypothetical protein